MVYNALQHGLFIMELLGCITSQAYNGWSERHLIPKYKLFWCSALITLLAASFMFGVSVVVLEKDG